MLAYIAFKKVKVLLAISFTLLAGFNVLIVASHFGRTVALILMGNGLFGGMFFALLFLLFFEPPTRVDAASTNSSQ